MSKLLFLCFTSCGVNYKVTSCKSLNELFIKFYLSGKWSYSNGTKLNLLFLLLLLHCCFIVCRFFLVTSQTGFAGNAVRPLSYRWDWLPHSVRLKFCLSSVKYHIFSLSRIYCRGKNDFQKKFQRCFPEILESSS